MSLITANYLKVRNENLIREVEKLIGHKLDGWELGCVHYYSYETPEKIVEYIKQMRKTSRFGHDEKPTNAQEAKDSGEFKVGDKVRYSYSVRGADVDDIFIVVKVIDYKTVRINRIRDGREWNEFDYNLVDA